MPDVVTSKWDCKQFRSEMKLDGNLRSSKPISDFMVKFLKEVNFTKAIKTIPPKSLIDFGSEEPRIILSEDGSQERSTFIHAAWQEITNMSLSKPEIMVSCLMSSTMIHELQEKVGISSPGPVSFADPYEINCCQYPCVILVVDLATCFASPFHLFLVMSRATTSLTCIVNTSTDPIKINGFLPLQVIECRESQDNIKALEIVKSLLPLQPSQHVNVLNKGRDEVAAFLLENIPGNIVTEPLTVWDKKTIGKGCVVNIWLLPIYDDPLRFMSQRTFVMTPLIVIHGPHSEMQKRSINNLQEIWKADTKAVVDFFLTSNKHQIN